MLHSTSNDKERLTRIADILIPCIFRVHAKGNKIVCVEDLLSDFFLPSSKNSPQSFEAFIYNSSSTALFACSWTRGVRGNKKSFLVGQDINRKFSVYLIIELVREKKLRETQTVIFLNTERDIYEIDWVVFKQLLGKLMFVCFSQGNE